MAHCGARRIEFALLMCGREKDGGHTSTPPSAYKSLAVTTENRHSKKAPLRDLFNVTRVSRSAWEAFSNLKHNFRATCRAEKRNHNERGGWERVVTFFMCSGGHKAR